MNGSGESLFNSPPVNFVTGQHTASVKETPEEILKKIPPHMQLHLAQGAPKPRINLEELKK